MNKWKIIIALTRNQLKGKLIFKKFVFQYRLEILPYRVFEGNNKYNDESVSFHWCLFSC